MIQTSLEIKKERCKMKKIFIVGFLLIGFSGIAQSDKDKNPELSESMEETVVCINSGYSHRDNCQSIYMGLSTYDMCLKSVNMKMPLIRDLVLKELMIEECVRNAVIMSPDIFK